MAPTPRQVNQKFKNSKHSGQHSGYQPRGLTGIIVTNKKAQRQYFNNKTKTERAKPTLYDYIKQSGSNLL